MEYVWIFFRELIFGVGTFLLLVGGVLVGLQLAFVGFVALLQKLFPSLRPSEEDLQRWQEQREAKAQKKAAALKAAKKPKKKSGPLFGSRQIEAMFLDKHADNPLARKAARKVRDKFF